MEHLAVSNEESINSLLPGMMNQGNMVGNRKGLVLIVTQNGEMLSCGMFFIGGTVALATTSLLSGRAFSGSFAAAQTKDKSRVMFEYI